jgi:hypothetical protein
MKIWHSSSREELIGSSVAPDDDGNEKEAHNFITQTKAPMSKKRRKEKPGPVNNQGAFCYNRVNNDRAGG